LRCLQSFPTRRSSDLDFSNGDVKMKGIDSNHFFDLLLSTTLEGAYSDPMYGGNRNMEGWKMKEYPGSVASYTDMIEEKEFVKMRSEEHTSELQSRFDL